MCVRRTRACHDQRRSGCVVKNNACTLHSNFIIIVQHSSRTRKQLRSRAARRDMISVRGHNVRFKDVRAMRLGVSESEPFFNENKRSGFRSWPRKNQLTGDKVGRKRRSCT